MSFYTTHDRDIVIADSTYQSAYAVDSTSTEQTLGFNVNNAQLRGVISVEEISTSFLLGGGLKDVLVTTLIGVDWRNPPADVNDHPTHAKEFGIIGRVVVQGKNTFALENNSRFRRLLSQGEMKKTSPICENIFCDNKCTLDPAPYTHAGTITAVVHNASFTFSDTSDHTYGTFTFTSGANNGLTFSIATGVGGVIELADVPYGLVEVGDTGIAFMGCAKTPDACKAYGNFVNFTGIPTGSNWMPGNDKYQQAPISRT